MIIVNKRILILLCCLSAFLILNGCAAGTGGRNSTAGSESGEEIARDREIEHSADLEEEPGQGSVYDIEKELPENRELKKTEKIEERIVVEDDSVSVVELEETAPAQKAHGIGYRVQIFASKELEKAKEVKRSAQDKISLAVYIEFEESMYKVRVGDFKSREEAAEARKNLKSSYPDCWIAETTIRK